MTLILGLTGSIGMGKSTVGQMFVDEGVPLFDADQVVHKLQGPGGTLVEAIENAFPGTTGEGGVDRERLSERVLDRKEALERLEALVHPAVADCRGAFLKAHCEAPLVVLDIPLLFEKGGWESVDRILVVSAPLEVQRERVLARPGMTAEKFARILALQLPDSLKRERADFVIPTGGSLDETRASVRRIIACLTGSRDS